MIMLKIKFISLPLFFMHIYQHNCMCEIMNKGGHNELN